MDVTPVQDNQVDNATQNIIDNPIIDDNIAKSPPENDNEEEIEVISTPEDREHIEISQALSWIGFEVPVKGKIF